jgi:hypothetical protein
VGCTSAHLASTALYRTFENGSEKKKKKKQEEYI